MLDSKKQMITSYWHDRANDFAKLRKEELHSPKQNIWLQEITKHLHPNKKYSILDVGCGPGFFSIMMSMVGHDVTGIDLTDEMIKEAKSLAQYEKASAIFKVMDAENLSFPDKTFDVILVRNVLWNLPHPKRAYEEWLRVLRPKGILLNFDAEYAKAGFPTTKKHAHSDLSEDMQARCREIYDILSISFYERPSWDKSFLESIDEVDHVHIDQTVGQRIYALEDDFYITAPMFSVKAIKK